VNSGTRPTSGSLPKSTRSDITVVGLRFAQYGALFVFRQPLASPSHLISLDEERKPSEGLYQVAIDWNRICWSSRNCKTPHFSSSPAVVADALLFLPSAISSYFSGQRELFTLGFIGSHADSDDPSLRTRSRVVLLGGRCSRSRAKATGWRSSTFQLRHVLESTLPVSPNAKPEKTSASPTPSPPSPAAPCPPALLLTSFELPPMSMLPPLFPHNAQFDTILYGSGG
jgi:hypothetical protein